MAAINKTVQKPLATATEFYESQNNGEIVLSSKDLQWQKIEVARIRHKLTVKEVTLSNHLVTVYIGKPARYFVSANRRQHNGWQHFGFVDVFPAGTKCVFEFDGQENDDLYLHLNPTFFNNVTAQAGLDTSKAELIPQFSIQDLSIKNIGLELLSELTSKQVGEQIFVESLAVMLALRLLRGYSTLPPKPLQEYKGGLPANRLDRVISYINDCLEQDLSLLQLAEIAGVSLHHFARQFKQSTGFAPHQFLIEQRIERAKQALTQTSLSVSEIAVSLGFSDQSHLTRHFKRRVGLTPHEFRRK